MTHSATCSSSLVYLKLENKGASLDLLSNPFEFLTFEDGFLEQGSCKGGK